MVVYRATPADVTSGVRVGDEEYPGYPASGAGCAAADPSLKWRSSRCCYDQELNTPIARFARDEAGNEATAPLRRQRVREAVQEKPDRDRRQVPRSRRAGDPANTAGAKLDSPPSDLLPAFLTINGELRRMNAEQIAALREEDVAGDAVERRRSLQLGNSQVEASFADHRTYFYKGKEVDQQVHLGFDLAVTAAGAGRRGQRRHVVNAELARHLRQLRDHRPRHGRAVALRHTCRRSTSRSATRSTKGQTLGRSGMTGLAGGDHLHFTMLVNGIGESGRVVGCALDPGSRDA